MNPFRSLRLALLATFVILITVTIAIVSAIGIWYAIRTTEDLVLRELVSDVELNNQAINNWLNERLYNLQVLSHAPNEQVMLQAMLQGDAGRALTLLQRWQIEVGKQGRFAEIFLIDEDGRVILSTQPQNLGQNHKHQTHFQQGQDKPFISNVFYNVVSGGHQIIITQPIQDDTGETLGLLAGRLDITQMTNFILTRAATTDTGEAYLVSDDRQFITGLRFEPQSSLAYSEGIDRALTKSDNRNGQGIYENYNGVRVVGAYRWLPELRVVFLSERSETEALAGVRQLILFNLAVACGVILLTIGVALYITQRITKPVLVLTEVATAISQGDLQRTAQVTSRNEIGVLAHAFNQMTERLRESINTLEERVQARTQELQVALNETNGLFKAAQAILGATELEEICQNLITQFNNLVQSEWMNLSLVDHEQRQVVLNLEISHEDSQRVGFGYEELRMGISGLVFATKQPILSVDAYDGIEPEATRARRFEAGVGALIVVPLVTKSVVIGTITAANRIGQRVFTPHDVELLMALATQAAAAIDNVSLFAEEQRQRQLSDSLRQIATVLNSSLERDTVLDQIMLQLDRVIGYDGAAVFLVQGNDLVIARTDGFADKFLGHRISLAKTMSVMVEVFQTKQAISLANVREDARWEVWADSPICSWMGAPLLQNETIFGLLALDSFTVAAYGEAEAQILQAFANQAALAIQNARLYGELSKLNADKDKFFSIVAHDLRGPFMPLLGNSDLLIEMAEDLSPLQIKQMAVDINRAAKNVFNLLENLLSWSRLQRGRMEYQPETVELHEITEDNVELLKANAQSKNIVLRSDVPGGIFVHADRNMLNTVIRNLSSNAIKFTPQGGQVIVSAQVLDSQLVEVQVADSGLGMSEEVKQKLFKIDQNVTTLGTAKEKGTGLGLIICQEMVEKSGGHIWVESEVGRGTTVKFTVRLERVARPEFGVSVAAATVGELFLVTETPFLVVPEMKQLKECYEFAMIGNMMGIERAAQTMVTMDETLRPFATHLMELARNFEDEELIDLLRKYISL